MKRNPILLGLFMTALLFGTACKKDKKEPAEEAASQQEAPVEAPVQVAETVTPDAAVSSDVAAIAEGGAVAATEESKETEAPEAEKKEAPAEAAAKKEDVKKEAPAATGASDPFEGRWNGVEGTSLTITKRGTTRYSLLFKTLDDMLVGKGTRSGDKIDFDREGKKGTVTRGDGKAGGMKWMADKKDCLIVKKSEEAYCRD